MTNCIITIGSVTQSMRAVSELNAYSIPVKTVKLSSGEKGGCIYGLEYNCGYEKNVKKILDSKRIKYGTY